MPDSEKSRIRKVIYFPTSKETTASVMNKSLALVIVVTIVVLVILLMTKKNSRRKHPERKQPRTRKLVRHRSPVIESRQDRFREKSGRKGYKKLFVPSKYPTINAAIEHAIADTTPGAGYRIILETQGPHLFSGARYSSTTLAYLSIEASASTDHMGMYYGHLTGAFTLFGDKGETNLGISGIGPFELSLTNANTSVTVEATHVGYPYGFGEGCLQTPNWIAGAPAAATITVNPNFGLLKTGDVIRWFDATTNLVSDHTITSKTLNSLIVTPAIPSSPLIKGSGFSVRPRATITFDPTQPFLPELVLNGAFSLVGVQLSQGPIGPIPSQLLFDDKVNVDIRKCLIHVQIASAAGCRIFSYTPNTYMDETNGVGPANLAADAAGSVYVFRQNFIGPSARISGYGTGASTCCFGLWVNNEKGVYLRAGSHCKFDLGEFVRCTVGIFLDGAGGCQAVWFDGCGTAMILQNGARFDNVQIVEFAPFPDFPIVIDGHGSGTGLVLRNNSQLYTKSLRLADVPFEAYTDGSGFGIPSGIVGTSTTYSNFGPGTYGQLLSSIEFENSWVAPSEC